MDRHTLLETEQLLGLNPVMPALLHKKRVCVIGCYGRMGSFLAQEWAGLGLDVFGIDQYLLPEEPVFFKQTASLEYAEGLAGLLQQVDVVVLCIPVEALEPVLQKIQPFLQERHLLLDITSIKVEPMQIMQRYHTGVCIGTHPLFGEQPDRNNMPVVLCSTVHGDDNGTNDINDTTAESITEVHSSAPAPDLDMLLTQSLFESIGCSTVHCTAEEHDKGLARIQGLNFVTTVAYFASLSAYDKKNPLFKHFLTPSFYRRLASAQKMLVADANIFTGMFNYNPFSQDAVREFRNYLNVAAGGDIEILVEQARLWFAEEDKK